MKKFKKTKSEKNLFKKRTSAIIVPSKKTVGIDIGSKNIKFAAVKGNTILSVASEPVPNGVVVDGQIEAMDILVKALRAAKHKLRGSVKNATLCLSGKDVIMREIKLPQMKEDQVLQNIRQELSNIYLLQSGDYAIDYRILETLNDEFTGEASMRVLVVSAPRALISDYIKVCRRAGIRLTSIDVYPNAHTKLIRKIINDKEKENAALSEGAEKKNANSNENAKNKSSNKKNLKTKRKKDALNKKKAEKAKLNELREKAKKEKVERLTRERKEKAEKLEREKQEKAAEALKKKLLEEERQKAEEEKQRIAEEEKRKAEEERKRIEEEERQKAIEAEKRLAEIERKRKEKIEEAKRAAEISAREASLKQAELKKQQERIEIKKRLENEIRLRKIKEQENSKKIDWYFGQPLNDLGDGLYTDLTVTDEEVEAELKKYEAENAAKNAAKNTAYEKLDTHPARIPDRISSSINSEKEKLTYAPIANTEEVEPVADITQEPVPEFISKQAAESVPEVISEQAAESVQELMSEQAADTILKQMSNPITEDETQIEVAYEEISKFESASESEIDNEYNDKINTTFDPGYGETVTPEADFVPQNASEANFAPDDASLPTSDFEYKLDFNDNLFDTNDYLNHDDITEDLKNAVEEMTKSTELPAEEMTESTELPAEEMTENKELPAEDTILPVDFSVPMHSSLSDDEAGEILNNIFENALNKDDIQKDDISAKKNILENVCFVDIGFTMSNVTFIRNGSYSMHKNIRYGGEYINEAISEKMKMDINSAESFKISKNDDTEGSLYEYYDSIISELDNTMYYYKTNNNQHGVDCIVISGGSSRLGGIKEYFSKQLNVPVFTLSEIAGYKINKKASKKSSDPVYIEDYVGAVAITLKAEWV